MRTHSSKVLHIQKKQKNKKKLIRVHVQEPQKYFTYKKKQQQNNRTTKSDMHTRTHSSKVLQIQKTKKTTKSDTHMRMYSSIVLHIQKNKTTKQQNLIHVHIHIPQKYFTYKKQKNKKT